VAVAARAPDDPSCPPGTRGQWQDAGKKMLKPWLHLSWAASRRKLEITEGEGCLFLTAGFAE